MDATELKRQARIEDLVSRSGFTVTGHGRVLTTEEHDSLKIWLDTNTWYWYRRGIGGDVYDWMQYIDGLTFPEAVERLGEGNCGTCEIPPVRVERIKPAPPLPQDLHLKFHRGLDDAARDWWHGEGIQDEAISRFFLGVVDHQHYGRCYSIPILEDGRLVNLRLRLGNPEKPKDKYRPYASGYGTQLYNSDILTPELGGVVITAGEKKAIVLWQYGIPAVSPTGGCGNWQDAWTTKLQFCRKVYIAFDPGETEAAWKLAGRIGERAHVVNLPEKPDSWIVANGEAAFRWQLRQAEPFADREVWVRRLGKCYWGRMLE